MGSEIEMVSDGDGVAIIGNTSDVERFFLHSGLDKVPSKDLDLHKLWSASGTAGAAVQIGPTSQRTPDDGSNSPLSPPKQFAGMGSWRRRRLA